ncbi:hypothetical protein H0H81_000720 [Sphagnurus paluster]|uniref:Uncharacterized protein n=1 Tax=Sphagnurus paluster TaxID=117069 RepID=A0A9P7GHF7_9AGAR|nr:hypothetical protein H0H81_000720 [Sphagnurus paluster]
MQADDNPQLYFNRCPGGEDWARFEKYAKLVREIHLAGLHHRHVRILQTIAEGRRSLNLFPNLHTLEYDMRHALVTPCLLFMHSTTVNRLKLDLPSEYPVDIQLGAEISSVMDSISRMSKLRKLEITGSEPVFSRDLDRKLVAFKTLTKLERIFLPRYAARGEVYEALANLPALREIGTYNLNQLSRTDIEFAPSLPPESFPALSALTISTNIQTTQRLLHKHTFFPQLEGLHIDLHEFDSASLAPLLSDIAQVCKSLQRLTIWKSSLPQNHSAPLPHVHLSTLTPILALANLTHLELRHPMSSPGINEAELKDLAAQTPRIRSLRLVTGDFYNPRPQSLLTLRALVILAVRCPHLRELELLLDAAADLHALPLEPPAFRALRTLSLNRSNVKDAQRVAFFLAQMLPRECVLEGNSALWMQVAIWIPQLVRMRLVTAERARVLAAFS